MDGRFQNFLAPDGSVLMWLVLPLLPFPQRCLKDLQGVGVSVCFVAMGVYYQMVINKSIPNGNNLDQIPYFIILFGNFLPNGKKENARIKRASNRDTKESRV